MKEFKAFSWSDAHSITTLVLLTTIFKLALIPFVQTVDPDAVSRIFDSLKWLDNPVWIKQSIWGPFHFYLTALALKIWNNPVVAPTVLNIVFSSLTLIPFYHFTKREFNAYGAFISTLFLAISPILFRNSFMGLSETPYLFFVALTMNFISKGLKENSLKYFIIAGIAITLASGLRYEAWLIMAIFGIFLFICKRYKASILFSVFALIFPIVWMIQSYMVSGSFLYGIQGNYKWTLEVMNNNANVNLESYLRRIWYFPFMWVISVGPPVAYLLIKQFIRYKKTTQTNTFTNNWFVSLVLIFLFFQYNAFKGTLLLQPRFIGTLVIFSLPFIAIYFNVMSKRKNLTTIIFAVITLSFSFLYNTANVKPLPRLKEPSAVEVVKLIKENTSQNQGLFIDFWNWENTHFIGLNSRIPYNNIYLLSPYSGEGEINSKLDDMLNKFETGTIIINHNSVLATHVIVQNEMLTIPAINRTVSITLIYENDKVKVLNFRKL